LPGARALGGDGSRPRIMLEHPEPAPVFLSRQSVRPNTLRLAELNLVFLRRARVLLIYSLGFGASQVPRREESTPGAPAARAEAAFRADLSGFPTWNGSQSTSRST